LRIPHEHGASAVCSWNHGDAGSRNFTPEWPPYGGGISESTDGFSGLVGQCVQPLSSATSSRFLIDACLLSCQAERIKLHMETLAEKLEKQASKSRKELLKMLPASAAVK